jgi:hypothetical protein
MYSKAGLDVEAPVQFLLLWTKVHGGLGHRNDLRLIDLVRLSTRDDCGPTVRENVLGPVCTFPIREGDQKAVVVSDRYDGGLVGPTRTAPNMTDD